jgi:predicted HD phosphohydrolase
MSEHDRDPRATFVNMAASTAEDWGIIGLHFVSYARGLSDRILKHLQLLDGDYGGFPVDRLTHCLQTATRAHRAGRDEEYVVCALVHDIGDTLGSYNHADVAAAIVKPFVSAENHWMVEKHAIFQGYYFFEHLGLNREMRETFREHPSFGRTEEFCREFDSPAFDPKGEALPLSFFEPMLRRVFAQPKRSIYLAASNDK